MQANKIGPFNWFILIVLGCIWGSSFMLMKIGAKAYNTMELSTLRMFFAGVLMIPYFISIYKKYDGPIIFWMFVSSMLGSAIPSILFSYSASRMDSNINGVINSLTPLFTMIVGILWLKYKTSKYSLLGVMIGFMGILLLITQRNSTLQQSQYAIFPLIATMMYGVNMNIVKVKLGHLPSLDILKGVFSMLGLLYFPLILYFGVFTDIHWSSFHFNFWQEYTHPIDQKASSLLAMFFLGAIGSLFASFIFYFLLKRTNALFSSMNTYLIPLVSIFWGYLDGEPIGILHFISLVVILIGVYLVGKKN